MPYVYELPEWPKLKWNDSQLLLLLAEVRHRQGHLLGRMENLGFQLRAEATLTTLTSDVVKSSAIEGERLDTEEVRSSIARRLGMEFAAVKAPGREVDGVVEMMLDATQKYSEPLTAERLFGWHASLFPTGHSGMHKITVAAWRPVEAGAMRVVSGAIGKERVHFEAPAADKLNSEMKEFLDWFAQGSGIDPVLKAGVAHFWFVTIHPFEDGNGRIGRALMDLALARAEGAKERFYSMSAQIESERKEYYLRLERCQRGDTDITPWLEWFLECLGRSIAGADESLSGILHKAKQWERINRFPVNDRQRKVINRLMDGFEGNLSTSKYAKLAKCSPDTALRDIQELLERGILVREQGGGRSTSYRLAGSEDEAKPQI